MSKLLRFIILFSFLGNCLFYHTSQSEESSTGMDSLMALFGLVSGGGSPSGGNRSNEFGSPTVTFFNSTYVFTTSVQIDTITPEIGGEKPLTNCVASPTLPDGLTLKSADCSISGTPNSTQSTTEYTIIASNSFGTGTASISITINTVGVAPTVNYASSLFTFAQNSTISTITPTLGGNNPTSCTSSPILPSGLSINSITCVISGTPIATQTATNYTITASNSYGSNTAIISITINANGVAPTISYSGSTFTFTQNTSITNITPNLGGNTPTSCTSTPSLPSGLNINSTTCRISGTPTGTQVATNHTITASNSFGANSTMISIAVNAAGVAPTISYTGSPFTFTQNTVITTITPTIGGNSPASCTSNPTLPSGLNINATSCAISGTPSGTQTATNYAITASNSFGTGQATINIRVNAAGVAPTINYSGSPYTFTQNSNISTIIPTLGGNTPTSCTSTPTLPSGLSISPTTCAISGRPSVTQTARNHTITASNSFGTGQATINIRVNAAGVAPTINYTGSPYTFTQNTAIPTITPVLGGNTPTSCISSPTLPSGLSINSTTCRITGTPITTQTATNYTITASNSFGSNTASISISISPAGVAPTISYSGNPFTFTQNSTITTVTPTLGGNTPTSCTSSPALPAGLNINSTTCRISGTPTGTQNAINYTITASNSFGSNSVVINIRVNSIGGSVDTSFNNGLDSFNISSILIQIDGKILISGSFGSINGVNRRNLARLNANGSLDETFNANDLLEISGLFANVESIALQPDGKILVGYRATNISTGISDTRLARLNSDGSRDLTFDSGAISGAHNGGRLRSIILQSDGRIIIGGLFLTINGVPRSNIARLNINGSVDSTFNPGSGFNNYVFTLALQSDNKILVGGQFNSYDGVSRFGIARLNPNGSLDTTLNLIENRVYSILVQSDGRFLIAGRLRTPPYHYIKRINIDDSVDDTFNSGGAGTHFNGEINTMATQSDGKILIGGIFESYNGISRTRLARLNANGSLDTSFDPGLGADQEVLVIRVQSDNKALVGGYFFNYNGIAARNLMRLLP